MEKYKKKSLNFMGFSREVRKTQLANQRCVSRHQRFSIIRPLDDESITEEKKENNSSRIPTIGKPKDQCSSRIVMLQKWKQEKLVKKEQESKLKKPAFKVGLIKHPPPSLGNKPLFALDTSSRLFRSSFQVSNSQLSGKRQESLNASNTKTSAKVSNSQVSAKKSEVDLKTSVKDMKIQPPTSKIGIPSKSESKWTRNKESAIQSLNMKPKVDTKLKVVNKDQLSIRKQPTIGSKPPLETKKVESRLHPLNARPKVTSLVRDAKSNIPSSGSKATVSRTLSTEVKQVPSSLPKATACRTLSSETKQAIPKKTNVVKSIPKFSNTATSQQKGNISKKTSRSESKVPAEPESDYLTTKPNKVATFECEVSHIEPVKEQRKSFAPPGFNFQPLIELNSSLFLDDGPSAIFLGMKNQFLRTSTPKQSPSSQRSSSGTEDGKSLQNEDEKCAKDENIQCPKDNEKIEKAPFSENTDKKLGSSHKYEIEDVLSSSLESVFLNDVKPIDCKQSLNFELAKVVSTQNQEEMLLPSNITHPELFLTTERTPVGVINPAILPDAVEIEKKDINSTDTRLADDSKITVPLPEVDSLLSVVIPDPIYNMKPILTQNHEEVYLSSNEMHLEHSLAREPTPVGKINSPILPDSVDIGKAKINSSNFEVDSKITVPFHEVNSVFSEVIPVLTCIEPDENAVKNKSVSNNFLQKQENSLKFEERKIRNFKRSEKPALSSINESLENSPKSALKKKVLDSVFTPRRSLRLAKLSGNFHSLENLLDTPTPKENKDKANVIGDSTPRRSLRLSKLCTEFNSAENLFDIRRLTLYGTPEKDEVKPKLNSRVTYDFDRLSSETDEETHPRPTCGGKVSLLYTPPNKSRPSIMRHSIKGDLMSFSPNM